VSVPTPRPTPRSAGASVDVALLRAARTELDDPERAPRTSFVDRIRALAASRPSRVVGLDALAARARREA
jgi:hypothetical protein